MGTTIDLPRKLGAELRGTFVLTFGGCGSAVIAAAFPQVGIGLVGVSLAFGLTVLTMAYAVGHISGGHFNPAVTIGLTVAGRARASEVAPSIIAQVVGAVAAAALRFLIASGKPGFAANGFGEFSPGKYGLLSGLLTELVLTAIFLVVILGSTSSRAPGGFAPIAIGLALRLIHLASIPVTNASIRRAAPAPPCPRVASIVRSTGCSRSRPSPAR